MFPRSSRSYPRIAFPRTRSKAGNTVSRSFSVRRLGSKLAIYPKPQSRKNPSKFLVYASFLPHPFHQMPIEKRASGSVCWSNHKQKSQSSRFTPLRNEAMNRSSTQKTLTGSFGEILAVSPLGDAHAPSVSVTNTPNELMRQCLLRSFSQTHHNCLWSKA